jgi:hypothetical protein
MTSICWSFWILLFDTWKNYLDGGSTTYKDEDKHQCSEVYSISSSSKVRPLYCGFPSPKTKFRHLSLSLVSSSISPWFIMLRLIPSVHLSLGLPQSQLLFKRSGSSRPLWSLLDKFSSLRIWHFNWMETLLRITDVETEGICISCTQTPQLIEGICCLQQYERNGL